MAFGELPDEVQYLLDQLGGLDGVIELGRLIRGSQRFSVHHIDELNFDHTHGVGSPYVSSFSYVYKPLTNTITRVP